MHLHESVRGLRRLAYLAAAALAIAAAVAALATMPPASALTNRRICQYVWQQDLGKQDLGPDQDPEHRMVSFVVNYKKDGECPDVDPYKVRLPDDVGQWMPFPQNWYPQPVPKMTCEEFQSRLQLPSAMLGGDACGDMDEDELYAVTGPLDSDHGPTPQWKKRTWPMGSVWKLQ